MTTARDIVVRALTRLRVVAPGDAVPAHLAADGLAALNAMLASWAVSGVRLSNAAFALADDFRFAVPPSSASAAAVSALTYRGTWNADTDIPTLSRQFGSPGDVYEVAVAGDTGLGGFAAWDVGEFVIGDAHAWLRSESSSRFERGIVDLLAVEVAPNYGRDPSGIVLRGADEGWQSLLATFVRPASVQFDAGLLFTPARGRVGGAIASTPDDVDFDGGNAFG